MPIVPKIGQVHDGVGAQTLFLTPLAQGVRFNFEIEVILQPEPFFKTKRREIFRKDTPTFKFTFLEKVNGLLVPVDLTNLPNVRFTAKRNLDDLLEDAIFNKLVNITEIAGGKAEVTLSIADTDVPPAVYTADVQLSNTANTVKKTVIQFPLVIVQDVAEAP